jgi:hypothetical protein
VLLSVLAGLVHGFAALASTLRELLRLVLDLSVKSLEQWEDGAFEGFCGLEVLIGDAL